MRKKLAAFFAVALLTEMAVAQGRLPFQKRKITLKSPATYEKPILRYDPKTGEPVYYDPKPRVVLLNLKSGEYALRWIGYDGRGKTIVYQRPDAIDAVVSASVSRRPLGYYLYTYNIKNLPSSGEYLSAFAIQTFASDVKPMRIHNSYVGPMSNNKEMKDGNWFYFGMSNLGIGIVAGRNVELKLESSAPPGLVECRITGGRLGMKGVGEEPPQELADVLPGYEAWPKGYTIGPIDKMKFLSATERVKYLAERLPRFRKLGWMTTTALGWYERTLRSNNLDEVFKRADRDLKAGNITSEVFDLIQAMK